MLWSFKALATFSLGPSRLFVSSPGEGTPSVVATPTIKVSRPECEEGSSNPRPRSCQCGYQQIDFCPYCEYDRAVQVEGSLMLKESASSVDVVDSDEIELHLDGSDPPSRPRKLRKLKPDYQQLQYEALNVEAVVSARPNSVLSTHSRTPLLNSGLPSSPNYLPLPPVRKTPKKLEKKEKRKRSGSMPNSSLAYSAFSDISDAEPQVKIVKSKSFLNPKNPHTYGPRPKPVSGSIDTDALVSLAWTGEVVSSLKSSEVILPSSDGSSSPSYIGSSPFSSSRVSSFVNNDTEPGPQPQAESSTPDPLLDRRRTVLRKQKSSDVLKSTSRPWTLAMAITDDGITDEKLVDDLEDMRIKDNAPEPPIPHSYPLGLGLPPGYHTQLYDSFNEYPLESGEIVQEYAASPTDSSWSAARQALLLCRELVRTERRYLASLRILITNGTNTPPPPSMLSYLPGLITASDALLNLMEQNPSVQGVSHAFMACKDKLSDSFLPWCGVVGQFFDSEEKGKSKGDSEDSRSRTTSIRNLSADSGLSIVVSEPNKIRRNSKARPAVRDLAILPTQRIVRYVLLFKELYSLTPPTLSSFVIVENAVQAAESIAQKADKAQGHSAFKAPLNSATSNLVLTPS